MLRRPLGAARALVDVPAAVGILGARAVTDLRGARAVDVSGAERAEGVAAGDAAHRREGALRNESRRQVVTAVVPRRVRAGGAAPLSAGAAAGLGRQGRDAARLPAAGCPPEARVVVLEVRVAHRQTAAAATGVAGGITVAVPATAAGPSPAAEPSPAARPIATAAPVVLAAAAPATAGAAARRCCRRCRRDRPGPGIHLRRPRHRRSLEGARRRRPAHCPGSRGAHDGRPATGPALRLSTRAAVRGLLASVACPASPAGDRPDESTAQPSHPVNAIRSPRTGTPARRTRAAAAGRRDIPTMTPSSTPVIQDTSYKTIGTARQFSGRAAFVSLTRCLIR